MTRAIFTAAVEEGRVLSGLGVGKLSVKVTS